MKNHINGLLLIDKPKGITSHGVVARVRRALHLKQVGHVGTLDPLATGLMGVLVGEATKISDYLRDESKSYQVRLQLGLETDSLDITGEVLSQSDPSELSEEEVKKAILGLMGEFEFRVPQFSAIKRDGKKLYERARNGEDFTPPLKFMKFYNLEIQKIELPFVDLSFDCTKGSYVRSWVSELGKALKVGATMTELRRTRILNYRLEEAVELELLDKKSNNFSALKEHYQQESGEFKILKEECLKDLSLAFYDLSYLLPHWKAITIQGRDEKMMLNGAVSHDLNRRLIFEQKKAQRTGDTLGIKVMSYTSGQLLSLLEALPNSPLKIRRVFK